MKSKKWLISLGLAIVLVVSFALPGCGGGDDGGGGGGAEPASRLNIAVTQLPNSLSMNQLELQNTNPGSLYLMLVYEGLYGYAKVDEDLGAAYDFVPKLAVGYDWSYEPDGTGGQNQILTLDLREGVKWHDGEEFTADDVVFSMKNKVISPWAADMPVNWTWVNSEDYPWCDDDICPEDILVEKTGKYQVQFTYVQGYHQPEDYLPCDFLWYGIVPEHVFGPAGDGTYDEWNEDPGMWDGECIGTGPYKVKKFVPDEYLLLERNDDYWGKDDTSGYWGLPAAKEVLFKLYEEENAMYMAFESDDPGALMDVLMSGVIWQKEADYESDPRIKVEVQEDLSILVLGFNLHPEHGSPYLRDMEEDLPLRQAIAAAIDKQGLCDMVFGGYAEPADSWVYKESPNHHPSLPNNTYNLAEAANILTAANYTKGDDGFWYTPGPDSTKIQFKISAPPSRASELHMIVEDLRDFGLDVEEDAMDSSSFYDILYYPNEEGALEAFLLADDPSPDPWSDWIWCYYADPEEAGLEWNPWWYDVPEFDNLYWANYLTTDMEAKKDILLEMQEMLAEDIPTVFLTRAEIITACRTDRWDNWFNELGGYATWINEYSIREVTPVPVD